MILYEVLGRRFNNKKMPEASMIRLLMGVVIDGPASLPLLLRLITCTMIMISMMVIVINKASDSDKSKGNNEGDEKGSGNDEVK